MSAAELALNPPWRTDDPPKDGTVIVAIGNMSEDLGDGLFNVEPFTDSVSWDGESWVDQWGLAVGHYLDAEVTIRCWLPHP